MIKRQYSRRYRRDMSGDHDEHDTWEYKQEKLERKAIKLVSEKISECDKESEELLIYILKKICN